MNRWWILAVLFLARTAMGFQFQSLAAVSPLLMRELAIDFALLGMLVGIWMLPGVAAAIPGALLGRRFGDKQVVCAGLVLMALGSFMTSAAESYALAFSGRLVSGVGAVMLNVLLAKMVADWFQDRELATAMSLLVTSWPLGIGLALLLLGPLAENASWRVALDASAWSCIGALVAMAFVYRRPSRDSAPATPFANLTRRQFALAAIAGLIWTFYNAAYSLVVSFVPVLLAVKGLHAGSAAMITSAATWPLMLTVPLGGWLADRTGRGQTIMMAGFLAMAVTMLLMLLAPSPLAMLAFFGLVAGPAGGIIAALPGKALPPHARHMGLGIFFTLYYLGMALLPGAAGWLRERSQLDSAPLVFGAVLLVAAGLCSLAFRRVQVHSV